MSMLSCQVAALRNAAAEFEGYQMSRMLSEAADTIEGLRDRLQEVPAELDCIEDKSRYAELFGTPERAAQTIMDKQLTYDLLTQCDDCPYQTDECFDPSGKCAMDDYDALLEWLRGDAE